MDKEQVRKLFPESCKLADELRSAFGDGVKLVYLQEGDRELGKSGEHGVNPCGRGDEFVEKSKRKMADV